MRRIFFVCAFFYSGFCFSQEKPATVKEYKKVFTTYPFSDPNPIPLLSPVYPYFRFDGFTNKPVQQEWKVVELENDYIKLLILPEIGGKIWTAIEKSNNRPFIYYNHAVKFRDVAMRGPWTSGGLESNFGIIGHTPNCSTPVDYNVTTNEDGSVSCTIGALDLLSRSNWRMEINLPKDKAYFTTRAFWYNATAVEQPYYHWMNAGLKAKGNLEFIYPGTKYIGHEGEYADWPLNKSNGKKISWYEENNFGGYKSYHVFGKYTDFSGSYWHDDELGMVRYGQHDGKAGKKLWIWGLSGQGMIWEKLLTDSDGQYIELQSGRRFNQNAEGSSLTPFKQTAFAPFGTDTWKEYWYPVLNTKGFVQASTYGALNIKQEDGWLKVYFSPVQSISDTLEIKEGDKIVYTKKLSLHVLQPFVDSLKITINPNNFVASLGRNKLVYKSDPKEDVLSRPVETPKDFDWNSAYGLYLLGRDAMDGKDYAGAEKKLKESLEKMEDYLPASTQMAALLYRNMRYAEALEFSKHALAIDTYDPAANYYYGLVNMQLGNMADAKDGFDIATLSTAYRSAAYTQLAKIYFREKNSGKAIQYARQAIDFDRYNMEALQLQAIGYRYTANEQKAMEILGIMDALDPLNHFVRFEKYLWHPTDENRNQFVTAIRNELPNETLIEYAIAYYNLDCRAEAEKLFSMCSSTPEASYWLSFLQQRPLNVESLHPDFSFPFRSETAAVIEHLLTKQNNWLLKYHLALIYKDRNRITESKKLLNDCGNEPRFAPFYAVRATICADSDHASPIADLKMALSLDGQWRYHKLLAEYYILHRQYDSALLLTRSFYRAHPGQYIMGMLYAKTLLLNKKYKEADGVLTKLDIIPFEGATDGRELYREAKLMQAVQQLGQKKYAGALAFISQAKQWPENLGVGKPYDADIDLRLEYWITYQCNVRMKKDAGTAEMLQRIIAFSPRIDNTVRNFIPANALVTAWAYEKLNQRDKGIEWLNGQVKQFPSNKIIAWCRERFEKSDMADLPEDQKDANLRIIGRMMKNK